MRMRTAFFATVPLTLSLAYTALSQVPPPPPPGAAPPLAAGATAAPVASGRVKRYLLNPNGEVDGLMLEDGTQVNFPPHLSAPLLQMVRRGDTVSVQGIRGPALGAIHASAITNVETKRTLLDQPPSPDRLPPSPPALTALNADGRVAQLLHADMGELNGVLLEDGTIIRWPPPFGAQLLPLLKVNASLKASGFGSESSYGRVLEATSVAINGQSPIAVYGPGPAGSPAPGARPPAP